MKQSSKITANLEKAVTLHVAILKTLLQLLDTFLTSNSRGIKKWRTDSRPSGGYLFDCWVRFRNLHLSFG